MGRANRKREREQRERLAKMAARGLGPDAYTSLEQQSPSLRHMAANGLTPDGNLERLSIEADMANTPGWRGRWWLRALVWAGILIVALSILSSMLGLFS